MSTMGSVKVVRGDLFGSNAQTLVNTVNCVGVMGKGVALQFKKRFPEMFAEYFLRCRDREVRLGEPYVWAPLVAPWVLNFPTKDHWRSVAKLQDIVNGLDYLGEHYVDWGIESLAVPPLGCGEGQLDWHVVAPVLVRKLSEYNIDVELYAPLDATERDVAPEILVGESVVRSSKGPFSVDAASVALAIIVRMVERERYHWPIGRVTFQKLAYFATTQGIPTGLVFQKRNYGPFSRQLKSVQTRLINNGLLVEERNGSMLELRSGQAYKDAVQRNRTQLEEWRPAMVRVADLLLRSRPERVPILATAHFVAASFESEHGATPSVRDVVDEVRRWKPTLKERDVVEAIFTLNVLGWLSGLKSSDPSLVPDFASRVA